MVVKKKQVDSSKKGEMPVKGGESDLRGKKTNSLVFLAVCSIKIFFFRNIIKIT